VKVVRHPVNLGVGGPCRPASTGRSSTATTSGVQLDADGQHDPDYLAPLLAPVVEGRCDVSIGSRFVAASGYRAPFNRRIGMMLFQPS